MTTINMRGFNMVQHSLIMAGQGEYLSLFSENFGASFDLRCPLVSMDATSRSVVREHLPDMCKLSEKEFNVVVQGIFLKPDYLRQACERTKLGSLLIMDVYKSLLCGSYIISALEDLISSDGRSVVLAGTYSLLVHYAHAMADPRAISIVEACIGKSLSDYLDGKQEFMRCYRPDWNVSKSNTYGPILSIVRDLAGGIATEMLTSRAATEKYLDSVNPELGDAAQILIDNHWNNLFE